MVDQQQMFNVVFTIAGFVKRGTTWYEFTRRDNA